MTRGAQGDAIKKMSTMAYALDNKWNEPLIIQQIYVQVDRKQGEIKAKFADTTTIDDTDTEIVLTMPPLKGDNNNKFKT